MDLKKNDQVPMIIKKKKLQSSFVVFCFDVLTR